MAGDPRIDCARGPKHAWRRCLTSLARVFAEERGITLVMALGVMVGLTTITTTAIVYTGANVHATGLSRASTSAFDVAEAGINDSLARMNGQLDPTDGSVISGGIDPRSATLFPSCLGATPPTPSKIQYPNVNGEAWICGDYNAATFYWALKSVGRVSSAGVLQTRTLTKSVKVVGINDGANGSSWSRFYQDAATPCLTIDTMTFVTNVATRGNLCILDTNTLVPFSAITGTNTIVDVGGNVTILGPVATSGPRSPTLGVGWETTPTNVYANDGAYAKNAIATLTTGLNQDTKGFGFAIPATAKILGIAVAVEQVASVCCNVNAKQTISESGSPTAGTFTITGTPPGGVAKTSVSLGRTAPATGTNSVQTALEGIFGVGNVTCSGGPLPAAVPCTFLGIYASMSVNLMTFTKTGFLPSGATPVITNTTNGVNAALQDSNVQLLKAGSPVGSNKALGSTWDTVSNNVSYGSAADLWGTTWTAAEVNNAAFGLRFAAKNVGAGSATASMDYASITVTYNDDVNGIGASGVPIAQANIGGTCTYNAQPAHTPCTSADHVYATTIANVPVASNPAISMPEVDFPNWWADAMPGPNHFCTNPTPGLATTFFDNDAALSGTAPNQKTTGNTTGPNQSIGINGEMAPNNSDYTCQVWSIPPTGGTLLGELSWNHTTHILTIFGTIFVDGNFRFDNDGQVVHYKGRATIMSSRDDEIDAVVCAGGSGTTTATSCLTDMTNWNTSTDMMVLMSEAPNEYDQGSSNCTGAATQAPPNCYNNHLPAGFQGIMYSTSECWIHQNFQDSGPVICNTIKLGNESGVNPTFFTFPSIGNLTDGQKYSDTTTATNFQLDAGDQSGG
jgi:hypothetical protein